MQIFIQSSSFKLTRSLKHYVEKKIKNSLGRRTDDVKRIYVRLFDINGPHGGIDKRCHLHLTLPNMADVVIQNTQDNLYDAINLASIKAKSTLNRRLSRQKLIGRSSLNAFRDSLLVNAS